MIRRYAIWIFLTSILLSACSSNTPKPSVQLSGKTDITAALLAQHQSWQGTPYLLGGIDRNGIDCSAFTKITYRQLFNIAIPRTTAGQAYFGETITKNQLRPGDLVLFRTGAKQRHVGIFVSHNRFLHASTSKGVVLSALDNPYWAKHYWKAIRPNDMANLQKSL